MLLKRWVFLLAQCAALASKFLTRMDPRPWPGPRLTKDSPAPLLVTRDLGGSGSSILTTEVSHLRECKLWPLLRITDKEDDSFPFPRVQS